MANAMNKKLVEKILKDDKESIELLKQITAKLSRKYKINEQQLLSLIKDKEVLLPISIFIKKLTPLEAITKYLKEELLMSYHKIGLLLDRNEKNIWHAYEDSRIKHPSKLTFLESKYFIPVSIFEKECSIAKSLVLYLKDQLQLNYKSISVLLSRNERTIWTVYKRAKKKNVK